ncbi:hypothetical protein [Actinomadura terrae]|uniref:hypothetical protein n=1 Tax=Actinomadura terrae TaxID=604353 RepID=UPI001FA7D03A|nr:hypothetical protein [Actinomadura terrae]
MSVRHGFYADWRGGEYEASPDGDRVRLYATRDADGFHRTGPDRFVRVVPEPDVDRLFYVSTRCVWRGEPFVVLGEQDGWLRLEYSGGDARIAQGMGLELFDRDVYQAWAARDEVRDMHEEVV